MALALLDRLRNPGTRPYILPGTSSDIRRIGDRVGKFSQGGVAMERHPDGRFRYVHVENHGFPGLEPEQRTNGGGDRDLVFGAENGSFLHGRILPIALHRPQVKRFLYRL